MKILSLISFLVVFSFFEKTTYCCRVTLGGDNTYINFVCPAVEIISFRGISISNKPLDLKMSMNVRKGEVHVRKAWVFRNSHCKLQFFCNLCCNSCKLRKILPYFPTITVRVDHNFNLWPNVLCILNNKSRPL